MNMRGLWSLVFGIINTTNLKYLLKISPSCLDVQEWKMKFELQEVREIFCFDGMYVNEISNREIGNYKYGIQFNEIQNIVNDFFCFFCFFK